VYAFRQKQKIGESPISRNSPRFFFILDRADLQGRYSALPFNILGQVCLPFMVIWFFLSLAAILLDDYMRYFIWNEEKPRYKLF